jgi:hypothetical protein
LGNPGSNITKEYERCFSEAEGSGVALRQGKGTTLGERRSKADAALPVEPKTTHWQVEGAPRAWSVEKFAILLTKQEWKDVTALSNARGWQVRATAPNNDVCHIYETSEYTIIVHHAGRRPIKRKQEKT